LQLSRKRTAQHDVLSLAPAAQPPWLIATFVAVLALSAVLLLAGVELPPDRYPALVPLVAALLAAALVARLTEDRGVAITRLDGRTLLAYWSRRGVDEVALDELATVYREPAGATPELTLTDLRGAMATIPLGTWTNEPRLIAEIDAAIEATGAKGGTGSPVPVHRPGWITPARVGLLAASAVPLLVFVNEIVRFERVEPVTAERIEETAGRTTQPFAGTRPCNVYVVPLDRPSEELANDVSRGLAQRMSLLPCALPSLRLAAGPLDPAREQVDASVLAGRLGDLFVPVWKDRPSVVIGITEHDMFSSGNPDLRFVFGFSAANPDLQAYAPISTARMGSGEDRLRRLETMAMRYVGLHYFGLETSDDRSSVLYHTIRSRADLDRMRLRFADPELSDGELRQYRARFLAGSPLTLPDG
jgi:hypothetical protein